MATALTSSIRIGATLIPSTHQNQAQLLSYGVGYRNRRSFMTSCQVGSRFVGLKAVSFTPQKRAFPSLQSPSSSSSACRVFCVAKPETVRKVCEVVKKQLALSEDASVTPESNFSEMGADSLDTLEIVMALEEEFNIAVQEEGGSENIMTVQAAANMIERYLEK